MAAKNTWIWIRMNCGEVWGFRCELGIRNNTSCYKSKHQTKDVKIISFWKSISGCKKWYFSTVVLDWKVRQWISDVIRSDVRVSVQCCVYSEATLWGDSMDSSDQYRYVQWLTPSAEMHAMYAYMLAIVALSALPIPGNIKVYRKMCFPLSAQFLFPTLHRASEL